MGLALLGGLPRSAVIVPAIVLAVVVCTRWPAAAAVGVILLTGTAGSLTAFTAVPPAQTIDLLLLGLWLGVAWRLATGRYGARLFLWPGVILPALFVAISLLWVFAGSASIELSFHSYRASTWYIAAFVLIAIAPWPPATHVRIARGALLVFLAVGTYAVLRKLTGPTGAEEAVARANHFGLPFSQPAPFTGSFLHANHLGSWSAFTIPFALALAFAWRGRWRLVAALAVAACTFSLLSADRRAATVGAVLGVVVTLILYSLSARAFRAPRIAITVIAVAVIAATGTAGYLTTIARDAESAHRFETLITAPEEDEAYQIRLGRWATVIDSLDGKPLGHGLGSVGGVARTRMDLREVGPEAILTILDSSYLKIAYEQGLPALILFALAYLALMGGLAWRATQTSDRTLAGLAIGACGTMGALLPIFYANMMIEGHTVAAAWILIGLGAAGFTRVHRSAADRLAPGRRIAAAAGPKQPAGDPTPTSPRTPARSGGAVAPPPEPAPRQGVPAAHR